MTLGRSLLLLDLCPFGILQAGIPMFYRKLGIDSGRIMEENKHLGIISVRGHVGAGLTVLVKVLQGNRTSGTHTHTQRD